MVLTLGILMTMVFGISQMMRQSFDLRQSIGQQSKVTRRLNSVLDRLNKDLTHAFYVPNKDAIRTKHERRTAFLIQRKGASDTLKLTTMSHRSRLKNSKESDVSYVVYEVQKSQKNPNRSHLMRGEFPRVPENFKEDPRMEIIAEDIESISIEPWLGDDWSRTDWDASRGETQNIIPHMVRVVVKAWSTDSDGSDTPEGEGLFQQFGTVVYIPGALDYDEVRQRLSSFRL